MSFPIKIPFYAFKIHLSSGGSYLNPLNDETAVRFGVALDSMVKEYRDQLQEKMLNKGKYDSILEEFQQGDFCKKTIVVSFKEAKDRISYPSFSLEFDIFYKAYEQGYWGIVPAYRVESYAEDFDTLEHRLEESIRIYFIKNKKLQNVRELISTIWYDSIELLQQEMPLKTYTPKEIAALNKEKPSQLLPKVARLLDIQDKVVYGRTKELEQMIRTISSEFSKNIIAVGPSGVGKTALVWETARALAPDLKIWETTASILIKELTGDTGWQDNLAYLCQELSTGKDILFIRNLMDLFEVGKYEGNSVSMADYLRNYINRGEIVAISECTEEEFAKIELQSPNYLSFFQIIRLEEPKEDLEEIILKKVKHIASDQEIQILDEAIQEVIRLNKRFTPYAGFPGKPIRFLESIIISNKGRQEEQQETANSQKINRASILDYFCEESGMPKFMIDPNIPLDLGAIKKQFNESVYGQEQAVNSLSNILARVKTALARSGKPIASFLFVGPTGVGKTELAKVLAEFMFGHRNKLLRFDMSEYSSPYAVMRLIGTDYDSDGVLTSAIRREPFSVLLFDEIEKAHSNFYDLLLQVLSEGRLTDSRGKLVNFCSTIIIMTSNIGASNLQANRIGWKKEVSTQQVSDHFLGAVQKAFRPELLNRIDEIIPFEPLDAITIRFIVEREINIFKKREGIAFRKITLNISEPVLDYLGTEGYHSNYGARFLQRTIREEIIIPLSYKLNEFDFDDQLIVNLTIKGGAIQISIENDPMGLDLLLEELDKINHADHASSLRRELNRLQEGSLFVRLLSEIDILERDKKELKDKFWKTKSKVERYTAYTQLKADTESMLDEIEDHELNLNMAALSLSSFQTTIVEAMKRWEEGLFGLKKQLYSKLTPKSNIAFLTIYGARPQPLLAFYRALFRELNFDFEAMGVWFRESYYYRPLTEVDPADKDVMPFNKYLKRPIELHKEEIEIAPPKPQDLLCGVEFKVFGDCSYLYLMEEIGYQKWLISDEGPRWYVVNVENVPFQTPDRIHRKEFYTRQNIRRTVEMGAFRDTQYKVNRQLPFQQLVSFVKEKLDERFKLKLNMELF